MNLKMKLITTIILLFLFCGAQFLNAQENFLRTRSGKIGLTFSSFGSNDVHWSKELAGAASYDGNTFYTFGITFINAASRCLEIETGIEYTIHHIIIRPNLPPDSEYSPAKKSFGLINIPVTVRANFLKYFFVNGGIFIGIDTSMKSPVKNQAGIGVLSGFAVKYNFRFGVSVFVNPYTKIHSLLPFSRTEYHQRIWENGIRIGLTYDLGKNALK